LKPDGFESARARFLEHFDGSSGPVVVDLSEASSVDIFGLQVLVGASKWASVRERAFSAIGAPESLRTLCRGLFLSVSGIEEQSA
jgi:anti-anti-sigma regulatory factor